MKLINLEEDQIISCDEYKKLNEGKLKVEELNWINN